MCPTEEESEPKKTHSRQGWSQTNPEASAEYRRRYREAHPEKIAALNRAWRESNPERTRELNRLSAQRQAHRRRQRLKHNAHGRAWRAQHREVAIERSRRFREQHPESALEYQRRYKERHPERARRNNRLSVQRYRDANAHDIREKQRSVAAARREAKPDEFKQWYAKNLEAQRARGREASRLRSRLKKLGLPPRRIHRVFADERRAHEAAADGYFARRRSVAERGAIAAEARDDLRLDIPKVISARRRVVLRSELVPLESATGEPLLSNQDRRLPSEVLQWRRARDLQSLKESHERLVEKIRAEQPQIFEHHRERREARLREEIRMDSIARSVKGAEPYELEQEVRARLENEVTAIINRRLEAMRDRTIERGAAIVRRHRGEEDAAAPHRLPGGGPDSSAGLH